MFCKVNAFDMDQKTLLRRVRYLTTFFIVGLLLSGVTAIPLIPELNWLLSVFGESGTVMGWIREVRDALVVTDTAYPFLAYGMDWLAFGHFVIALVFVGAWRDPVRNIWLFEFGMIACVLVIPYALVFGAVREIPMYWRVIDMMFGVIGFLPLWYSYRLASRLERMRDAVLAL